MWCNIAGLPSFKPVIYKNPAEDEESEEEEDEEPSFTGRGGARVSQTHGYYGHQAPNTYYTSSEPVSQQTSHSQQVRLHRIPVQHISTSRQAMEAGDKRSVTDGLLRLINFTSSHETAGFKVTVWWLLSRLPAHPCLTKELKIGVYSWLLFSPFWKWTTLHSREAQQKYSHLFCFKAAKMFIEK